MIQRIQTVWLFLASLSFGGLFALPFATAGGSTDSLVTGAYADGTYSIQDNIGLFGLTILGAVLALAAIFLFKNRPLQGKIAGVGVLVSVLLVVLAGFVYYQSQKTVQQGMTVGFDFGWILPPLAGLLMHLAFKGIKKDDNIVRSMDRLR